jgi:hypothetical protein
MQCSKQLFGYLVGAQKKRLWYLEAQSRGGGQIDDELELGWLLDRDVGRLCSAQNLIDKIGRASILVRYAWTVGHQTSRFDVLPIAVHRRQSRAERQGVDANTVGVYERVAAA